MEAKAVMMAQNTGAVTGPGVYDTNMDTKTTGYAADVADKFHQSLEFVFQPPALLFVGSRLRAFSAIAVVVETLVGY